MTLTVAQSIRPLAFSQQALSSLVTSTRMTAEEYQQENSLPIEFSRKLESLHQKPFWIRDDVAHLKWYDALDGQCCFNHMIQLPEKDGELHPIFDYELELFDSMFVNFYKHLWVKKARGIGITEFLLRVMCWLCLSWDGLR